MKRIIFYQILNLKMIAMKKIRILRGKFPLSVVNIVTNAKYKTEN